MAFRLYLVIGLSLGAAAVFYWLFCLFGRFIESTENGRWRKQVAVGYLFLLSGLGGSWFWVATDLRPFRPPVSQLRLAEWSQKSHPPGFGRLEFLATTRPFFSDRLLPHVVLWGKTYFPLIILLGIIVLALRFFYVLTQLHFWLSSLPRIRKIGRVEILVSSGATAFSTWLPWRATVVVPISALSNPLHSRSVIAHELQHHRQRDTLWLFAFEGLRVLYFWNSFLMKMLKAISQFQEFACDEALICRRKVSPQAYTRCLLEAAESAIVSRLAGIATLGPLPCSAKNDLTLLKRRVKMITQYQKSVRRSFSFYHGAAAALCLGAASFASYAASSALPGAKLTLDEARVLADRATAQLTASGHTGIPIQMNGLILEKLNQLTRTPTGKKWMKDGIERMRQYEGMILSQMNAHSVPEELIAIPLFESGFKNLPPTPPQKGAGIWEFIAPTAKRYRLEVSGVKDDRLNAVEETRAAMEYLRDLNQEFKDWRLAVKAYNEGESSVREMIEKHGTRDPWVLEQQKSPEGYLAGVMAVIILLKNPELLS